MSGNPTRELPRKRSPAALDIRRNSPASYVSSGAIHRGAHPTSRPVQRVIEKSRLQFERTLTASREPARWTRSSSSPIVVSSIFTAAGIVDGIDAISPSPSIALVTTLIVKFFVWGDCALLAELNVAPDVIPPPTLWLLTLPTFMFLVLRGHATEGPTNPAASHDGLEQVMDGNARYAGHIQPQRCGFNNSNQRLFPVPWPSDVPKQQQLSIDPTPLVIVPFLFFFVTFFGLTLLATSKHMHHAHKLGVLYVVGSVTRKWLDQAKALEQPTALGAQDSPAAPIRAGRHARFEVQSTATPTMTTVPA
ncbi:uncharacterized protein B0T23DRAFT_393651 [Neurospora hispaniola]|uniref:Uncharacterized protein n=1 Tax=Neurospora hispaniola TaxID=588809 RepID=A0AAJ0ICX3_9PEZI|nr:hypothetical protein B0T23DRAFT_393651 [Neurospora hispaniola]